ncbi:MAG: MarR family winged helix-turn-helix transcriptional regulator [Candidatus Thorarchaeota archaeon]
MYELVESLRRLSKVRWFLGDRHLSLDSFMILDFISELDNCRMKDIVTNFSLPPSTATGIIDRLVDKKYIKRDQAPSDRRTVVLEVTSSGRRAHERFRNSTMKQMDESLSHLSEDEIISLLELVKKLAERMGQ